MNIALLNPAWSLNGSICFGCPDAHLPIELGYTRALLQQRGHSTLLIDAQQDRLSHEMLSQRLDLFRPDYLVITTAPDYVFWRYAPHEIDLPLQVPQALHSRGSTIIAVGQQASSTPQATLQKLHADVVVLGEFEQILAKVIETPRREWKDVTSICYRDNHEPGEIVLQGSPQKTKVNALPALQWPAETIRRHWHHHHRFDRKPEGPGAEMEVSRGRLFLCPLCATGHLDGSYRTRPLRVVLNELDGLIRQGVEYVYFIDEHFQPDRELLESLMIRPIAFGVRLRISQWNYEMLKLLGQAGCVSIEAVIEDNTETEARFTGKPGRLPMDALADRLIFVKQVVPFVQATFAKEPLDHRAQGEEWRKMLLRYDVWTKDAVPLSPHVPPHPLTQWKTPVVYECEGRHDEGYPAPPVPNYAHAASS